MNPAGRALDGYGHVFGSAMMTKETGDVQRQIGKRARLLGFRNYGFASEVDRRVRHPQRHHHRAAVAQALARGRISL